MAVDAFPPALFDFFRELKDNNDKAWFDDNRARYEADVKAPLQGFIAALAPKLKAISGNFVADPKRSMFRIHRDVRFSADKAPYKTNAGLHFRHAAGKDAHAPGFYLHLEPGQVFYGAGLWKPPSEALGAIREAIDAKPDAWRAALADKTFAKTFGGLGEGDPLSRAPKGYAPDHALIEDLKKRSFFAVKENTEAAATRAGFLDEVAKTYAAASPLMRFLTEAVSAPF